MVETVTAPTALPVGAAGNKSSGWFGVWMLIVTEGSLFGYLLLSYYYLWAQTTQHWPPDGLPKLTMPGLNTVLLISSSLWVYLAERNIRRNNKWRGVMWFMAAIACGAAFVVIQLLEWRAKNYGLTSNLYGSLYFTITGFHVLHVVVGLIVLFFLMLWSALGYFDARRYEALSIGGLYWHFVDVVWVFIFSTFFLVPYLS